MAAAEEEISKFTNQLQEAEAQRKDAEFKGQDAFTRLHEKERDLREADKNLEKLQEQVKYLHKCNILHVIDVCNYKLTR